MSGLRKVLAAISVLTIYANKRADDIPDGLFRQMTTCQTAANEFLRQFWSSIYPPPLELQTVSTATPTQRAAKAAKMVAYISKTPEKVQALVQAAQQNGVDAAKVEVVSCFFSLQCNVFLCGSFFGG